MSSPPRIVPDGASHDRHGSPGNLRKRSNVVTATNGEYRLSPERKQHSDSDSPDFERAPVHGIPKSLTPLLHRQNTEKIDAEIDAEIEASENFIPPSRQESAKKDDVEAQQQVLSERTIDCDTANSFHASNLTIESDPDSRGQLDCSSGGSDVDSQNRKIIQSQPGTNISKKIKHYDDENDDELVSESRRSATENNDAVPGERSSLYAKFQKSRRICGKLVNNALVQTVIILLIIANAILMGIETSKWVQNNPERKATVSNVDHAFLIIFTIEIAMQLYYYWISLFLDPWLVFDLVVVIVSWIAEEFQVVRSFRIFRVFRLVTRLKPLRDLVLALGEVLPRMLAIMALLLIVFYVFAVLFTEQFSHLALEEHAGYFENLQESLFTCFQMMTMEWADICRELMDVYPYAWITIIAFVLIAGFIVFNLIVAVVVEAVSATEETVRRLDGIESNSPAAKLAEAQERVDLLQSHLDEMMEQQEQIQFMLETMAAELLHLEKERMKSKMRENRLLEEINRRDKAEEDEKEVKLKNFGMKFLKKIEASKEHRSSSEEMQSDSISGLLSRSSQHGLSRSQHSTNLADSTKKKMRRRMSRDGSGKSIGETYSDGSNDSAILLESPNPRSIKSSRTSRRGVSMKAKSNKGNEEGNGTQETEKKKKAINNWKSLLAVSQGPPIKKK